VLVALGTLTLGACVVGEAALASFRKARKAAEARRTLSSLAFKFKNPAEEEAYAAEVMRVVERMTADAASRLREAVEAERRTIEGEAEMPAQERDSRRRALDALERAALQQRRA
jgi:hypothetical protein